MTIGVTFFKSIGGGGEQRAKSAQGTIKILMESDFFLILEIGPVTSFGGGRYAHPKRMCDSPDSNGAQVR